MKNTIYVVTLLTLEEHFYNMGESETRVEARVIGVFSDRPKARKAMLDSAKFYFAEENQHDFGIDDNDEFIDGNEYVSIVNQYIGDKYRWEITEIAQDTVYPNR